MTSGNKSNLDIIFSIKYLLNRAHGHHLFTYEKDEDNTRHIEAFLLLATILEGILVNYALAVLQDRKDLTSLMGKRKNRYIIDNAINDLYLLGEINTQQFGLLERFKNKRNEYIHYFFAKDIKSIEKEMTSLYDDSSDLILILFEKLEKKLKGKNDI